MVPILRTAAIVGTLVFCAPVCAQVYVTGTGTLKCSDWLKAREDGHGAQVDLNIQWIAGFAVGHNYYAERSKQVIVDLNDIRFATDKFCRDTPLATLMLAAAQYVQDAGGAMASHNKKR